MKNIFLLIILFFISTSFAQYNIAFDTLYFGGYTTENKGLAIDNNNNSYSLVYEQSSGKTNLTKRDLNGNFIWKTPVTGTSSGYTLVSSNYNDNLYIYGDHGTDSLKFIDNQTGNMVTIFPFIQNGFSKKILNAKVLQSGDILFTGIDYSNNTPYIARYTNSGVQIWYTPIQYLGYPYSMSLDIQQNTIALNLFAGTSGGISESKIFSIDVLTGTINWSYLNISNYGNADDIDIEPLGNDVLFSEKIDSKHYLKRITNNGSLSEVIDSAEIQNNSGSVSHICALPNGKYYWLIPCTYDYLSMNYDMNDNRLDSINFDFYRNPNGTLGKIKPTISNDLIYIIGSKHLSNGNRDKAFATINTNNNVIDIVSESNSSSGYFDYWNCFDINSSGCFVLGGNHTNNGSVANAIIRQYCTADASISEKETTNFVLYPNPTSNKLTIEYSNLENEELRIFDITGKHVSSSIITGTEDYIILDVSSLISGIYFIEINSILKKFIKE